MRNHPSLQIMSQLIKCSTRCNHTKAKSVKDWILGTIGTTCSKSEWHHVAGVFSSLVKKLPSLAGVSTSVFGFTTNFSVDTANSISQISTHLTFSPLLFNLLLPPEPLDCRRATCCSRVSLVMFSSSSSDRASAISPHLFNQRLPAEEFVSVAAAAVLPSAARRASPGENGVDSKHSESQQHDSSLLFSRR